MKILTVASLVAAAGSRPPGYVEHILGSGQVVVGENGEPEYVALSDSVFDALVEQYAPKGDLPLPPTHGPGTELKKLLASWPFRIVATPNCSCNARAAEMDRQGIEWCEANMDAIVGWLREEAGKRGLPFLDAAGRMLIRRAIRNARRAAS